MTPKWNPINNHKKIIKNSDKRKVWKKDLYEDNVETSDRNLRASIKQINRDIKWIVTIEINVSTVSKRNQRCLFQQKNKIRTEENTVVCDSLEVHIFKLNKYWGNNTCTLEHTTYDAPGSRKISWGCILGALYTSTLIAWLCITCPKCCRALTWFQ